MTTEARPSVLFVCVHNAGRSQLAAAYAHHLSHGRVEVRSAGSARAELILEQLPDPRRQAGRCAGSGPRGIRTGLLHGSFIEWMGLPTSGSASVTTSVMNTAGSPTRGRGRSPR